MAEKESIKRIHEGHNDANFDLLAKSILLTGKSVTEAVENLTSAETDVSDIRAALAELTARVDQLETGESGESTEITEIKAEIEALTEKLAAAENTITLIESDITGVKSDVQSAQSTAEAAKSTADQAYTEAGLAGDSAEAALTAAQSAQSTAETAQGMAENAQQSANQAITETENVQSIAQSAMNTALENVTNIQGLQESVADLVKDRYIFSATQFSFDGTLAADIVSSWVVEDSYFQPFRGQLDVTSELQDYLANLITELDIGDVEDVLVHVVPLLTNNPDKAGNYFTLVTHLHANTTGDAGYNSDMEIWLPYYDFIEKPYYIVCEAMSFSSTSSHPSSFSVGVACTVELFYRKLDLR